MAESRAAPGVWFVSRFYNPNLSGAAVQAHQTLALLVRRGYRANVLTAAHLLASQLVGQEVVVDGVTVRYLPVPLGLGQPRMGGRPRWTARLRRLFSSLAFSLRCGWVLWREAKRHDIVQFYGVHEFTFLVAGLARALGMHPVVKLTLLGTDDPSSIAKGGRGGFTFLRMLVFRLAEAIVGNSTAQIESCLAAGFRAPRVTRIPGGVDLGLFLPVDDETRVELCQNLGLDSRRRFIAFVGSSIHRKGIDVLIRSFQLVAQQIDDVDLLVVGPSAFRDAGRHPPDRQELVVQLKQELAQAGFGARVRWTGTVDNVHQYLQVSEAFCFPTRREGFGNVLPEAMAVGLPVVAARLEGVTTDIIDHGKDGLLLAGHRPADYAEALMLLLGDATLAGRLAAAARVRASSEYDLNKIASRFEELYWELQARWQSSVVTAQTHWRPGE